MGAVWMKQNDSYYTFLLPGFEFKQIKGAINPNRRGIKLDNPENTLRAELTCFKDSICDIFGTNISNPLWERQLDKFLNELKSINSKISIDLDDSEGYCIGESFHDGCKVFFDKSTSKVIANIDFSITNAQVCSIVFFTEIIEARRLFIENKTLKFRLKVKGDVSKITVELHLKSKNPTYVIYPDFDWQEYSIHLQDFNSKVDNWETFKELAFLTDERSSSKCTIEISDIRIE